MPISKGFLRFLTEYHKKMPYIPLLQENTAVFYKTKALELSLGRKLCLSYKLNS